jgi:phage I-like protein
MLRRNKSTGLAANAQDTTHHTDANTVVCAIDPTSIEAESRQQVIQLIPQDANGRIIGADGRHWLMDANALMAHATASKTDFPIDYNHASLDARKTGASAPAAGWVDHTSLEARPDGLYGRVQWNAAAVNHLTEREFRYTSPVFTFNPKTGKTLAYKGSGLTHYPNLGDLTPVANQQEEDQMDEIIEEIREALNLPTASNAAEIKIELDKLFSRVGTLAANSDAKLIDQIGMLETRLANAETKAAEAIAANSQSNAADFVPRTEFDRVKTQLDTITTAAENERVETAVNAAIESGKIAPASKAWAEDLCRNNQASFDNFVTNASQVVPLKQDKHGEHQHSDVLTDEEVAVCSQLGLSKEEFLKSKKEESE